MTLEDIITRLESYGYKTTKSHHSDLAWAVEQAFNKVPEEDRTNKEELVLHFKWNKPQSKRNFIEPELNFTIYEDESVTSDGKLYYTPGRMHYYFNFGNDISKIYRDDELNLLMNEIHTKLSKRMGVDELRNIKLIDMGI
jgi:hypothetical protein